MKAENENAMLRIDRDKKKVNLQRKESQSDKVVPVVRSA